MNIGGNNGPEGKLQRATGERTFPFVRIFCLTFRTSDVIFLLRSFCTNQGYFEVNRSIAWNNSHNQRERPPQISVKNIMDISRCFFPEEIIWLIPRGNGKPLGRQQPALGGTWLISVFETLGPLYSLIFYIQAKSVFGSL